MKLFDVIRGLRRKANGDQPRTRNLARVLIADCFLLDIMRQGTVASTVIENALPEDARIVAVHFDGRVLTLTVEGSGLPMVADGEIIPQVVPLLRRVDQ